MEIITDHFMALLMMALLLLCSAFFSGTETALFSLTREQIKHLRKQNLKNERLLGILSDNPAGLLIAILFGNLVVNILFFCLSAVLAMDAGQRYGGLFQAVVGLLVLLVVILVGEIIPKAIGISFPERVVQLNAFPLQSWFHFMGPVRRVLEVVTRAMEPGDHSGASLEAGELKMLIEATQHDTTFGRQEQAIIEEIVNLPELRVREMMVPRVKQLFCRSDLPAGDALRDAAEHQMELIPVYEESEDNVIGVVQVCELFVNHDAERPLADFVHPVHFVPETKRADEMLREFLSKSLLFVCVVNEYGGLSGTVCLENLLQEVVGDFDAMEVSPVEQLGETKYRLQGNLGIREWRSLFVGFLPDEVMRDLALDTISGLVVSLLKRMPAVDDVAQVGNLRFTVEEVRSHRIEKVVLELVSDEGGAA